MLNMLLAIIMDTYTEVKGASSDKLTLPQQLFILLRRLDWIRRGEGLPLDKIDARLEQIYGYVHANDLKEISIGHKWAPEDIITVASFAEMIDGLSEKQAERVVTAAVHNWRVDHLEPLSLTEAMNVISLIHRALLDQSRAITQNLQQITEHTRAL